MGERITVERMGYGSAAVGRRADGKTVFVEGAAPGTVQAASIKKAAHTISQSCLIPLPPPARQCRSLLCV